MRANVKSIGQDNDVGGERFPRGVLHAVRGDETKGNVG